MTNTKKLLLTIALLTATSPIVQAIGEEKEEYTFGTGSVGLQEQSAARQEQSVGLQEQSVGLQEQSAARQEQSVGLQEA